MTSPLKHNDAQPKKKKINKGSSTFANFISANFITAIFQNFPKIFGLCIFWANYFITAIFMLD